MPTLRLETPLLEVLGGKNVFLKRLENLGIKTVGDALNHFPVRYEDFSRVSPIAELASGTEATVCGVIADVNVKNAWRKRMSVTEAVIEDESGSIRAVWFNQPYIANALRVGRAANFSGKVSLSREGDLYFNNPSHEILRGGSPDGGRMEDRTRETKHTGRLIPIYPETKGLTSRGIRFIMSNLLARPLAALEWIPPNILASHELPGMMRAFSAIHFPKNPEDAAGARRRFLFENLFLLQIVNARQKMALAEAHAPAIPADIGRIKIMLESLPFELTPSQKRSLWEIVQDLGKPHPMNRLLQGDVGSGKTVVAAIASMTAAEAGLQTAFMAPTEILARQHFETFQKFLKYIPSDIQPTVGLITGNGASVLYENDLIAKNTKEEFWKKVSAGQIAIIFGTHALITKLETRNTKLLQGGRFRNLGLVIVDEQHRFGVNQRKALLSVTRNTKHETRNVSVPHFLSMSATPIPRTLMMTVFGDLDVSLITELPAGRKPIETKIVAPEDRAETYSFIRQQIKAGRQAFVICPRIEATEEESENPKLKTRNSKLETGADMKMVTEEYERLSKKIFPELRVGMLHGKMRPKEKETTMGSFKGGELDIIVATSVIEVGVDIPNASVMMIESADRFGLAQLYQFRGRIGRGAHQSYCFLFSKSTGATGQARLGAIVSAKNGFELAEKDLALRGPGEFFGAAQSGFSDTALSALRDPALIKLSRDAAAEILREDPSLTHHSLLKERIAQFESKIHLE